MATSNLVIAGNTWTGVPALDVAKSGGGTTRFTDVSDTTATASDVKQGKYFYTAQGERIQGTIPANPTMSIDDVIYEFDSGTRYWYDWVYSDYSPGGSSIEYNPIDDTPYIHIGGTPINYGISGEYPGDQIVEGFSYVTTEIYQIIDLTGTTWQFNTWFNLPFDRTYWDINFTSNNTNYTRLELEDAIIYYGSTAVFEPDEGPPTWVNDIYRTIHITGGTAVRDIALYAFLAQNATEIL